VSTRGRIAVGLAIGALIAAAIVFAAVGLAVPAFALTASALVFAAGWAFYEVGAGEDRDRREGRD